jgi:hypothetical protein
VPKTGDFQLNFSDSRGTELADFARAGAASETNKCSDAWAHLEIYFNTGSLDLL